MRAFLIRLLVFLAKATLRKYRPRIVGVTGSVGKTSTVAAIALALQGSFRVRSPHKNYNNEIGLPLVVFGEKSPGRSVLGWGMILLRAVWRLLWKQKEYPEVLVLEYGADHRGDIAFLSEIARPEIAVITAVGTAHAEFLGTQEDIWREKSVLARAVPSNGRLILCADNEQVLRMAEVAHAPILTYGFAERADVRGSQRNTQAIHEGFETSMEIRALGIRGMIVWKNAIGEAHGRAVLAGCATASAMGVPFADALARLSRYEPIAGRMRVLPGRNGSWLLDDTYNASPEAVHAALDVLATLPLAIGARRFALLGDMRELGRYTTEAHRAVGVHAAHAELSWLMAIGEESRTMADSAVAAGMPAEEVMRWARPEEAALFVEERLAPGDLVLLKGSQGIRMERATAILLHPNGDDENPPDTSNLLCRQGEEWQK